MARFLLPNTERRHMGVASRTRGVEQARPCSARRAIGLMLRACLEGKALDDLFSLTTRTHVWLGRMRQISHQRIGAVIAGGTPYGTVYG